ncbi:hypothetical protein BC938DRAFT_474023 [Jimgerdemannia flammicorona]|uniref:Uncharacterized protein n=1 Tax=Jimgerdemannia flammicorona TaxID=994334 RepID=A0A433Q2X6_9FUNG|nr:hypothetical protein BC938DRAFT_474023 [Jimgerdemannia flammicorona]
MSGFGDRYILSAETMTWLQLVVRQILRCIPILSRLQHNRIIHSFALGSEDDSWKCIALFGRSSRASYGVGRHAFA